MIQSAYPLLTACMLLAAGWPSAVSAQQIGNWTSHTSQSTVNFIEKDNDGRIWSSTDGGLFVMEAGEVTGQYTPTEGMYRVNPTAMAYDSLSNRIWLGYLDGTFEYFDLESQRFRTFREINRADRFNPRGINNLKTMDHRLYIATDFGVVIFNMENLSAEDTFFNLGEFGSGVRVHDIVFHGDSLYCATPMGIAAGNYVNDDLVVPGNWYNYTDQHGLTQLNIHSLGSLGEQLFASTPAGVFRYTGSGWTETGQFGQQTISRFRNSENDQHLLAISDEVVFLYSGQNAAVFESSGNPLNNAFYSENPQVLYTGTTNFGLAIREMAGGGEVQYLTPPGPYLNFFTSLNYDDGVIFSGSSTIPGESISHIRSTGYYIYRDHAWHSFNNENVDILRNHDFNSVFRSASTNDYYFFGSWGKGLARHHKETDEISIFNTHNSPIEGFLGPSSFVVISGLSSDRDGNLWIVSWQHDRTVGSKSPLYRFNPTTEEWTNFPRSNQLRAEDAYFDLKVDSFNQKWIRLATDRNIGRGLLILRTDGDSNDAALRLNESNGHIPHDMVHTVVQDRRGEIWLGTDRGVVRYAFPDRIIDGSEQDRRASFLINADTTDASSFLLTTIRATSIAVNAANEKWIGTQGDGLWLIGERGGRHYVKHHFTTQNSPLISDNITSLAIDETTGQVFIATDAGLISYTDVTRGGEHEMSRLFIYPNPYSYRTDDDRIIIDGLSDQTIIRIVSVDGRLVNRLNARGGRVEWDVRDFQGNEVGTGVYMIIAVDDNTGERGSGKVVIVR